MSFIVLNFNLDLSDKNIKLQQPIQLQLPHHFQTPPRWRPPRATASPAASDTQSRPRSRTSSNDSKNVGSRFVRTSNVFTGLFWVTRGTIRIALRSGPILTLSRRRYTSWSGGTRTNSFGGLRPQSKSLFSRSS